MKLDYKSLSIFIGIGYIIIGALIIGYKKFFMPLSDKGSITLGFLLLLYGFYRVYGAIKYIKKNKNNES